jgi:hypothetical protein
MTVSGCLFYCPLYLEGDERTCPPRAGWGYPSVIFDLPHSDLNNVEIQGVLVTRLAVQQCSPLSCLWKERGSDSQGLGPS